MKAATINRKIAGNAEKSGPTVAKCGLNFRRDGLLDDQHIIKERSSRIKRANQKAVHGKNLASYMT